MSFAFLDRKFILAFFFVVAAYWQLTLMRYSMTFDTANWFFPMRYFIGECLQNNILPVWNPYTNLGYPIHTDPQSGALYPIVWILGYFFGYSSYTIHFEHTLHLVFALWGMYRLAQVLGLSKNNALIVAITYVCCGFFIGNATHLTWIISATWIPFVFLHYHQLIVENHWKSAVGLSLFLFLLLTGGYPAFMVTVAYLLLITFFIVVIQRIRLRQYTWLKRFVFNNVLFFVLFLLQSITFLVYFIEVIPYLLRVDSFPLAEAQKMPFSPNAFLSFILPFSSGGDRAFFDTGITMSNGYFGVIAFLLMLFGLLNKSSKKEKSLLLVGVIFLLIALGDYFILRAGLYHFVPLMDTFRYPALFRIFTLLCFVLLFGFSLQKINTLNPKQLQRLIFLVGSFMLLILGIWSYAFFKTALPSLAFFSAKGWSKFLQATTLTDRIIIQAPIQILILILFYWSLKYLSGKRLINAIFLLVLFDLFLATQLNMFITVVSSEPVSIVEKKLSALPKAFPIPKKPPFGITHSDKGSLYPLFFNTNLFKKTVARNGYNNFKLKTFSAFEKHPDYKSLLKRPVLSFSNQSNAPSPPQIEVFSPTYLRAKVNLQQAEELLYLQSNYPGWEVLVNNKKVPHYSKADIFLATKLPPGEHIVEFIFHPKNYLLYLMISVITFIFCLFTFKEVV